jgi:septal ring factor EnvC (AmiA/AmiB activator)
MSEQNLTLFEIETKIAEAADRAVEGDENALSVLSEYLNAGLDKRDRVAYALRHFQDRIDDHDREIKRLQARKAAIEKKYRKLSDRVISIMRGLKYDRLEGRRNSFALYRNPPSVRILNADEVPANFKTVNEEVTIDKRSLAKALKENGSVPGAELATDEVRLKLI